MCMYMHIYMIERHSMHKCLIMNVVWATLLVLQLSGSIEGCKPGWILNENLGKCYRLPLYAEDERVTWDVATIRCNDINAELVCLTDMEEQTFLLLELRARFPSQSGPVWLGLSDRRMEGQWECINGTILKNVSNNDWVIGRPLLTDTNTKDCMQYLLTGELYDSYCDMKTNYICSEPDTDRNSTSPNPLNTPPNTTTMTMTTTTTTMMMTTTPTVTDNFIQTKATKSCGAMYIPIIVLLSILVTLFMGTSLVFIILYIRKRGQKKQPDTILYDRPVPKNNSEHMYQEYNASSKENPAYGRVYDSPQFATDRPDSNRYVQGPMEGAAYAYANVDNA